MSQPKSRRATYDDLLQVPAHRVAELVDGELFVSPRPASRHAHAAVRLVARLESEFGDDGGGPGGWWIVFEPELHLGHDVLVPDIAGWRHERMPEFPDVAAFELPPNWICEIVSPHTGGLDRVRKLPVYAAHQVAHAWVVDPIQRSLEVYVLAGKRWTLQSTHSNDDVVRAEPFDSIELRLERLWI